MCGIEKPKTMVLRIPEANTCIRGCCTSNSIPLHLPPSAYTLLSPIAKGAESVVYEGILDGVKVAVKKPILSTSDHLDKFHKELQMLCKMDHPGIATLIAANAKPPNYLFFFRLYESNSLAYKLHVEEWSPNIDQVLMICIQLARALQYLHDHGIVHRDVKPANMLLDRNLQAYLSDFGLAEYKEHLKGMFIQNWKPSGKPTGGFHKKNVVGTLIYMAPEVLRKEVHSEKSDVYGFGVSMNELLTGVVPYTDVRTEAQAHTVLEMNYTEHQLTASVVSSGLRPVLADHGSGVPVNLLSLIERCWDPDLNNRPPFRDIAFELEGMLRERQLREKEDSSPVLLEGDRDMNIENNIPIYKETLNWCTMGERLSKTSSAAAAAGYGFEKWLQSLKDTSSYNPVVSWGSFATCGRRETMEDTHFLMPYKCGSKDVHAFGVFDGHRGAAAAEFSAQALPALLKNLSLTTSPADALVEAFIQTDGVFRTELDRHRNFKKTHQKNLHPGCTAAVVLIVGDKLFVANAGDCRTILCQAGYAIPLSKDHTASCPEERERVITAGGEVKWLVDTWRVGPAGLQVTRSIGDDDLKPVVIAEPEISETLLSQMDEYVVVASDGLWDVLSNEEVINIIRDTVKEPSMCSKRLATEAMERGSKDNITVVVIFLRPVSTSERVY